MKTVHLTISGKVQGVGFRYYAKNQADKLGITGWIENSEDGTVKAEVCGEGEQVDKFVVWCRQGPDMAKVDSLETSDQIEQCLFEEFKIK